MSDIRLVQLRRLLGQGLTDDFAARDAVRHAAPLLAEAFFTEAADSDDVTGSESAVEYLEARLAFFGDLLPGPTAQVIRAHFAALVHAWD